MTSFECWNCGTPTRGQNFCSDSCAEQDHYTEGYMETMHAELMAGDIDWDQWREELAEYERVNGETYTLPVSAGEPG